MGNERSFLGNERLLLGIIGVFGFFGISFLLLEGFGLRGSGGLVGVSKISNKWPLCFKGGEASQQFRSTSPSFESPNRLGVIPEGVLSLEASPQAQESLKSLDFQDTWSDSPHFFHSRGGALTTLWLRWAKSPIASVQRTHAANSRRPFHSST